MSTPPARCRRLARILSPPARSRARPTALAAALAWTLGLAAALAVPAAAPAQEPLPDEPASTLYLAALQLESDGEYDLADSLMDHILRRFPDSAAAAAIRRARVRPDSRRLDSSGRTELVVWSTLYGLWLGVAVPGALGVDEPEPYGLGLLVGGPLGFLVARSQTRDNPIGDGAAEAISWGGTWGTWQGFGWANVLDIGRDCYDAGGVTQCDDGSSSEASFALMLAGGAAGTLTGALLSRRHVIDPGDATSASLGSLWGTWYGAGLAVLTDMEGDAALGSALLGGNLGLLTGAALAARHRISRSQARVASIAGVAGGLAGAGIDLLVQPEDEKVAIAIPLLTSTLGLALGAGWGAGGGAEDGDGGPEGAGPDSPGTDRTDPPGEWRWDVGGPLVPVVVDAGRGERSPALAVTLLRARF